MNSLKISHPNRSVKGEIILSGSKSISNRALLIRALCPEYFKIHNLSDSDDTISMENLLNGKDDVLDAHHAGTTFRFLTAYLATKDGIQVLTGSERMQQRPVKALVDALNYLGADISYVNNEGYPPLKIGSSKSEWKNDISLPANISSQYITALLLIAPTLPNGLTIRLEGEIVSRPYIEMTIGMMEYFGVEVIANWANQTISIRHQTYIAKDYFVEADWSAASYYYTIAGLSQSADIVLHGLHEKSLQGDAAIANIGNKFGIKTTFEHRNIRIVKEEGADIPELFEYDFINEPDIAQSVSVLCAGLGVHALFTGLQTLRIKETDRIAALQNELLKIGVFLNKMPTKFSKKTGVEYYMQEGRATLDQGAPPFFDTYNDHRMAMSFAPLSLLGRVSINDSNVVSKSYPNYWKDLTILGFDIDKIEN